MRLVEERIAGIGGQSGNSHIRYVAESELVVSRGLSKYGKRAVILNILLRLLLVFTQYMLVWYELASEPYNVPTMCADL
jgi:hypothetical protein